MAEASCQVVCALCGLKGTATWDAEEEERPMVCPSCGMTTLIDEDEVRGRQDG